MPRTTLSAVQAELLDFTETLLVAADLLDDSDTGHLDDLNDLDGLGIQAEPAEDLDSFGYEDGDGEHAFEDFISEILKMQATITLEMAASLTGDGSRGSYNRYAKSADFFSTTLQSPDRQFRHQDMQWCHSHIRK